MRLYDLNTSASVKRNYIPGGGGWGFPGSSDGEESACKAGDLEIPLSGRAPGGGNGNSLQYSCVENPMDRGAW